MDPCGSLISYWSAPLMVAGAGVDHTLAFRFKNSWGVGMSSEILTVSLLSCEVSVYRVVWPRHRGVARRCVEVRNKPS